MRALALLAALALAPGLAAPAATPGPAELLGKRPPEWTVSHWRNGPPVKLAELRGKVVLVRWWTARRELDQLPRFELTIGIAAICALLVWRREAICRAVGEEGLIGEAGQAVTGDD